MLAGTVWRRIVWVIWITPVARVIRVIRIIREKEWERERVSALRISNLSSAIL